MALRVDRGGSHAPYGWLATLNDVAPYNDRSPQITSASPNKGRRRYSQENNQVISDEEGKSP